MIESGIFGGVDCCIYVYLHVYKYMHILYFHNNLGIWGGNL